jgi:ADP-ribosylglycohydrolase
MQRFQAKPHYDILDGLRGVAALMVIVYHVFECFDWSPVPHGYLAVDFFFVLSGFVIGYAYDDIEQVMLQAKASCYYTHAHREGIRGAQAVACAVFLARNGESKDSIRKFISDKFRYDLDYTVEQIRPEYSFDSSCEYSVPPSIVCFLDSTDYESAVRNAVSLGGDADTMACIAGGIAEAFYNDIPGEIKRFCDSRIDISLKETAREFELKYKNT